MKKEEERIQKQRSFKNQMKANSIALDDDSHDKKNDDEIETITRMLNTTATKRQLPPNEFDPYPKRTSCPNSPGFERPIQYKDEQGRNPRQEPSQNNYRFSRPA